MALGRGGKAMSPAKRAKSAAGAARSPAAAKAASPVKKRWSPAAAKAMSPVKTRSAAGIARSRAAAKAMSSVAKGKSAAGAARSRAAAKAMIPVKMRLKGKSAAGMPGTTHVSGGGLLPAQLAFKQVKEALQKQGLKLVMLEEPFVDPAEVPPMTEAKARKAILARGHLLLPDAVGSRACHLASELVQVAITWTGGDTEGGRTEMATALWEDYLLPGVETAVGSMDAGASGAAGRAKAFGELLGLLLFCSNFDCWLRHQELYRTDRAAFCGWFKSLSLAWQLLLAQGDADLQLQPKEGRPGGYRGALQGLLSGWASGTEALLTELFGHHFEDGKLPRLHVVQGTSASASSGSSSSKS